MFKKDEQISTKKTSDQEVSELILYGLLLVFIITVTVFFSPVLIFTLIFFLFMKFSMSSRISNIFSIFSLFSFIVAIYFWGILPLLQFAYFWKRIDAIAPILKKVEGILQQGVPFTITFKSYVLCILLSIFLAKLGLIILNRLGLTFFTNEKEDKREKYINSDKFKRFFKNKDKIISSYQKKYRKNTNEKKVFLGLNEQKTPVYFDLKNIATHALVQGTTGAGKTTLMYSIMESALRNNLGCVFIDGKGDGTTEEEIEILAKKYQKKVYVFSEDTDIHYNPTGDSSPSSIKDRFMDVMDWSDSFYEKEAENQLQMILKFIQDYRKYKTKKGYRKNEKKLENDIATIHRFLSLKEIADFLFLEQSEFVVGKNSSEYDELHENIDDDYIIKEQEKEILCKKYIKLFFNKTQLTVGDVEEIDEAKTETAHYIRGLRTQIELLMYSDFGEKFKVNENTLNLKEILLNGDIVLFTFNTNKYSRFMESMGKFIVADIASLVSELKKDKKINGFKGGVGFYDEFGSYVNKKILDTLRKSRSANFGAVIGVQSISDFKTETVDLTQKARNNINLFFLARNNDPENAEDVSNTIGTYKDIDRTVMTENQGGKLLRIETKGERGTVRKVQKYWFNPDEVKNLPNYTFLFLDKTNNDLEPKIEKVFIRNVLKNI